MKKELRYIVIDVDGTMTDGGIYYDEFGNEFKKFNTRDAAGFFAAREAGIKIVVLTGRLSKATERRMKDLDVEFVFQGVKDKYAFLQKFMNQNKINKDEIGYIGDDLNDLHPMSLVGYVGCPKDSCREILDIATYVSRYKGGCGAVRDIIEHLLRSYGIWKKSIHAVYDMGT